jgi:hypothetical protein
MMIMVVVVVVNPLNLIADTSAFQSFNMFPFQTNQFNAVNWLKCLTAARNTRYEKQR